MYGVQTSPNVFTVSSTCQLPYAELGLLLLYIGGTCQQILHLPQLFNVFHLISDLRFTLDHLGFMDCQHAETQSMITSDV